MSRKTPLNTGTYNSKPKESLSQMALLTGIIISVLVAGRKIISTCCISQWWVCFRTLLWFCQGPLLGRSAMLKVRAGGGEEQFTSLLATIA